MDAFKQETVTLDLQVIPTSSPLSNDLSGSESLLPSTGMSPHCSSSQLLTTDILASQAENSEPSIRPSTSQIITWPEIFQVPWEKMSQGKRSAIVNGNRPKPMERRQMVRVLVDEMKRYEANPTRLQCLTVIRNIIRQYPRSFADMGADGSFVGGGYMSLFIQVISRIENVNRGIRCTQHRHSRSSSTCKRGPSDIYGCTRFQPVLPPEETEETVEQSRQKLMEIYSQEGVAGAERAEVKNLMLLTDINVLHCLELSMVECGRAITQYVTRKPTNKHVKDVLAKSEETETSLHVVQLLMAHFGENQTGLVHFKDVCNTAADVETTLSVPASPRLILLVSGGKGQDTIQRWMITLEGRVVSEGITPTFLIGLAAVFATYYMLNLQYQEEAACTLEFIQRRFIGINPERGSKAIRGKAVSKKTGAIVQKTFYGQYTRLHTTEEPQ